MNKPVKVIAQWSVSLDCDCPKCGEFVNLLDYPDFWDGRHLEWCEHSTERTQDMSVNCPHCDHDFKVDTEY